MLFHRALRREFMNTGVVVFAVLLMITVTTQLIRMLGWAAQGVIPPDGVLILLGLVAGSVGVIAHWAVEARIDRTVLAGA